MSPLHHPPDMAQTADRPGLGAALAVVGVALQAVALGAPPWVALTLAVSFCGYSVVRKRLAAPAQTGLLVECALLAIPAIRSSPATTALLVLAGPATVVPLALFAFAARRLPLTVIGLMQFIAPTLQFFVGLQAGEALTPLRAFSFVFIWGGAVVFGVGALLRGRTERIAQRRTLPA